MNKFSRLILAIAMMLMMGFPSFAHDFEVDGIYYNYLDKTAKTVEVTYKGSNSGLYYNEYTGSVTIPSSVTYSGTTYSVTSIGSDAFYGCSGFLTEVTIPNSVTEIGQNAFRECTRLTSVTIPNSVTEIGSYAFEVCEGLTEVNISNLSAWCKIDFWSSSSNPLYYANKLKLNGTEIKNLVIPNDITEIKNYAFLDCRGLTSVTIPNSVTSIGQSAFRECIRLTSVTIPNSVTEIGSYAFDDCEGLTEVNISDLSAWCKIDFSLYSSNPLYYANKLKLNGTEIKDLVIPNDITEIKNYAFSRCYDLTSVTIPNSITSIGSYAFDDCYGLTEVTIPNSVTEIGDYAFSDCTGLTSMTIGNSVTSIGDGAFYGCSGLTSITIGNSVTSIGDGAFNHCWDLETIVSLNPTPPTCASSDSFYYYSSSTLYVPKDSYAKYFVDDAWGQFSIIKKIETLVSSITLNETALTLNPGSNYTLNATASPSNATIPNLTWESDNHAVATVDQNGKVTGISAGAATITVRANDGSNVSATCKVTVNSVTPSITLSQTEATLPVNDIMTLSYSITNSATKTATWSTSDANVAYVKPNSDGSATVVGMAVGVATITATVIDNGKEYSASCVVTVGVGGIEGVEADNNAVEVARYDIHGRLLSEPAPGINIVKYSDGTTRKEIVK